MDSKNMIRFTPVTFIEELQRVYDDKYDLSKVKYAGKLKSSVIIGCPEHGFVSRQADALIKGKGCPKCGRARGHLEQTVSRCSTTEAFLAKAIKVHGNKFSYGKVVYVSRRYSVTITCRKHGDFQRKPGRHLRGGYGSGCAKCGREASGVCLTGNLDTFLHRANEVHGTRYSYSKVDYVNSKSKVTITCMEHGDFEQTPNRHLAGTNCPKCKPKQYSKLAIEWIESIAKSMRLKNVLHAENGGEFQVPETRYWVDGYHARSKTVFEFHGDCFHGNPAIYKANSKPNPYSSLTAKQLYKRTVKRESRLRELGYTVISIWESEYRKIRVPKI